ncbi:MAG: helicase-exonuclease AddAB subunit AddA, partial [Oscillospiraceae bacterium]|nr:helicase-exonuclease AddAB subunit AddA [Oscillospiraceae bacterium]
MKIQLTESQQAVVENQGGSLLVSAAAGSGKTRVLVDRLFRRVLGAEQANIDEFLIITYTRAAAAELRERIAGELTEHMVERSGDRHLQRQLMLVYQADIKTIDAFCTSLLRENVHLLEVEGERGLTADFRVLDDAEAVLLRGRVLARVLEEFYADLTPGGAMLADAFGFGRDDRGLEELVLELYDKIQSHAYPEKWLEEQKARWRNMPADIGETIYGQEILNGLLRKTLHWKDILQENLTVMECDAGLLKAYGTAFVQGSSMLEQFAEKLRAGWDMARGYVLEWPRLSAARKCEAPELKEKLKSIWTRCKKEMGAVCAVLEVCAEDAAADLQGSAPAMDALLTLCSAFSAAYRKEKLRRNVTDFSDQEHYAISLLLHEDGSLTPLAKRISQRYREVMVDEYQDTNQVQNCIFSAISQEGKNLFTVGDVKQSIYRFRLADPTIFLEKYLRYPHAEDAKDGEPRKILLSQNFRSRQSVLDATNFVFSAIMSREMGEMDYGEAEQLNFGASYLPERTDCSPEFHLIDVASRGDDKVSRALVEARFVAERIRTMLDEGYPVADGGELRPCQEEDIVVLMRSPGPRLRYYARAFSERGISCAIQENEDFFSAMEVSVVYAFLQILDNPRQDVPLISVLRSPVFGFTPDQLALIRGEHKNGTFYDALICSQNEECVRFCTQLAQLRTRAKDMSVYRLIWHLYNTFNILGVFGAMKNGGQRRENLITLYEYARSFETAGYKGLFAFVSHLRFLLENEKQPTSVTSNTTGGVQIMSIHKSKGLEFPIVILADLNKPFHQMDFQTPVLVHPKLGLGPQYIDLTRHICYSTVARDAVAARLRREMCAEEMRVLYVGMTRAKEKLIMVASMQAAAKKLSDLTALSALPVPAETVAGVKSMAEWILLPLLQRREAMEYRAIAGMEEGIYALLEDTAWHVAYHTGENYTGEIYQERTHEHTSAQTELNFEREALEFVYPHRAASMTPTKLTATQLKGREKDDEIAENTSQPYVHSAFAAPRFLSGELPVTADQRGTATHLVMQYLPLDGDLSAVIRDLIARHLLTEEQARSVD